MNNLLSQNADALRSVNFNYGGTRILQRDNYELVDCCPGIITRIWYNDHSTDYASHWHNALEIIVPLDNYYDVTISEADYHVLPGEILIIPPGEMHSLTAPTQGKRFIFMLDISLISKLKSFAGIQPLLSRPIHVNSATYPDIHDDLYRILLQMQNEYFGQNEFAELTVYSLLLDFFVKLGTNHLDALSLSPGLKPQKQKEYVRKFNKVINHIDTHYMEKLSMEAIARSVGISKYHFAKLFRQYTGFTFGAYVCHRRIRASEELLSIPGLSVADVALQSGFLSISTFNRVFRQQKDCTPSQYRDKRAQGIDTDISVIMRRGEPKEVS